MARTTVDDSGKQQVMKKARISSNKAAYNSRKRKHSELKDMVKLDSNNEAFHLSLPEIFDILSAIRSHKTPTPKTFERWDAFAKSFYIKMCDCFGVDYQHLEATTEADVSRMKSEYWKKLEEEKEAEHTDCSTLNQPSTEEMFKNKQEDHMECSEPSTKKMSCEECVKREKEKENYQRPSLKLPLQIGSYSSGPACIPYHLYALVKKAVDMMDRCGWQNNNNDLEDLKRAENKIGFFFVSTSTLICHLAGNTTVPKPTTLLTAMTLRVSLVPFCPVTPLSLPLSVDGKNELSLIGVPDSRDMT